MVSCAAVRYVWSGCCYAVNSFSVVKCFVLWLLGAYFLLPSSCFLFGKVSASELMITCRVLFSAIPKHIKELHMCMHPNHTTYTQ